MRYQTNEENNQKRLQEYCRNLSEDEIKIKI